MPGDELSEEEAQALRSTLYTEASDLEICQMADLGDPVADEIFNGWPAERQRAAVRAADKAAAG